MGDGLMDVNDASKYLKLSVRKIRELISEKEIPYAKISGSIRFTKDELDRWVKKHMVKAG